MKPIRKDSLKTRKKLVDAAEALFAKYGMENVSLLEIGRATGMKNRNALQYHFGNKAGLINAVLDKHTDLIAKQRRQMLDQLDNTPALRDLVEAYVLPVANHIAKSKNSIAFLLINSHLMTSAAYAEVWRQRPGDMPEATKLEQLISTAIQPCSVDKQNAKLLLIESLLFHGLASYYYLPDQPDQAVFIDTLCSGIEAVLRQ